MQSVPGEGVSVGAVVPCGLGYGEGENPCHTRRYLNAHGIMPGHKSSHRHIRRGGAARRAAERHSALSRRRRPCVRCVLRRAAVCADWWRWTIRPVRSVGNGGIAGGRLCAAAAHPAGGNGDRHIEFGARNGTVDACQGARWAGLRRDERLSSAAVPAAAAACRRAGKCLPAATVSGDHLAAVVLAAQGGAGDTIRRVNRAVHTRVQAMVSLNL